MVVRAQSLSGGRSARRIEVGARRFTHKRFANNAQMGRDQASKKLALRIQSKPFEPHTRL
jgi:hypothetical protein